MTKNKTLEYKILLVKDLSEIGICWVRNDKIAIKTINKYINVVNELINEIVNTGKFKTITVETNQYNDIEISNFPSIFIKALIEGARYLANIQFVIVNPKP